MPKIVPDADSDSAVSFDDAPDVQPSKHTESKVEADVDAKEQLKADLMEDVGRVSGKKTKKKEAARVSPTPSANGEEQPEEDEWEVEAIRQHRFKGNVLQYYVKWKGFPESANTWEPEEHLTDARDILAAYHHKVGGVPQPKRKKSAKALNEEISINDFDDADAASPPAAKRAKRGQADASHSSEPTELSDWRPKHESWEKDVKSIETVERVDQVLYVFIIFTNGKRARVERSVIRKHCPMKLLDFYEDHLSV